VTPADRITRARTELAQAEADLIARLGTDRSRARAPLVRQLHEVRRMRDPDRYRYASQAGQDRVVDAALKFRRGGTFVDIGGYDGVTGSNSLFFELWRGWTGVLVEPVPAQRAKAEAVRRCPCLGLAIAATEGEADFMEIAEGYTQMSGLAQSYDPALLDRVRNDPRHQERTIRVQTQTLSGLLTDAGIEHPDFVSLDIEGGEVAVLEAFPFDRHRVGLWAIENNTGAPEIGAILRASGHDLIEFCGPDEIWRRRDL
jgi:FkbM family methyltransferase